jgi:hypothetical protein
LFDKAVYLNRQDKPIQSVHSVAWGFAHRGSACRNFGWFHPGFAWAARRELLETHGLLDHHILGGADSAMVCAMFAWWGHSMLSGLLPRMRTQTLSWARRFWTDVQGQVGCVRGTIRHLWHGERNNRRYHERREWLVELGFDPNHHLREDPGGLWEWHPNAVSMADRAQQYFHARREDG